MSRTVRNPNRAIVLSISGGKDSTAMLAYVCERYPDEAIYAVFADTGFEHIALPAGQWALEPKLDGTRALWDGQQLWNRHDKTLKNPPEVISFLRERLVCGL
jgi:hypothetical protein